MKIYMLDTNICSFIIREKPIEAKEKLLKVEIENKIILSSIVISELLFGAKKLNSDKLTNLVNKFISNFPKYNYDYLSAKSYATIRTDLEKRGTPIGANDLFIASHAMSLEAVLVTNNTREFNKIEGLKVEDWSKL